MASVINRTTLQYLRSVNTPEYPTSEWEINPDMSQVQGVDRKYWKWDGVESRPIPMDSGEQIALDIANLEASRDSAISQLDRQEDIIRAFANLMITELNNHTDKINAIMDGVDAATNLAEFKASVAALTDLPTRTINQFKTAMRNNLGS